MTWRTYLIMLLAFINVTDSKEETKKALIIAVDESNPEETDAIISDFTIKDQRSSNYPSGERSHAAEILERAAIDKQLDYILVRPEDLKVLKELEDIRIEKPKLLRYPESSSDESYEASKYTPYSQAPEPYKTEDNYRSTSSVKPKSSVVKYPSRPAPSLVTYSGGSSNEQPTNYDTPYVHTNYPTYESPIISPYKEHISYDTPKLHGSSYDSSKSITGSTYGNSKPSSYSETSSYSAPASSYENSKPSSYSAHTTYGTPKPGSYSAPSYYGGSKPSSYSSPYSVPSYGTSYPSSYSGPSTYETPNPNGYSRPSSYQSPNPSSYSGPSPYESSKPSSYSGPSTYENPNLNSYSGTSPYDSSKPSSYAGHSTYESPKPSSYSGPSTYESSKPSSYSSQSNYGSSGTGIYSGPENSHSKSKPSSYSSTSSYSSPESPYSSKKPSSYSGPHSYYRPSSPHYDSSEEKTHQNSEKYAPSPESHHPQKTYSYDYKPSKTVTPGSEYERGPNYTPSKPYGERYYNSPSVSAPPVKHVSYDDLPSPYKSPPQKIEYEISHSGYANDSPNEPPSSTYSSTSKPIYHDAYHHDSPPKEHHISKERKHALYHSSKPSYGEKIYDVPGSPVSYKPRSTYNSNRNIKYYRSSPVRSKVPYDTLKTSYQTLYGPSSYKVPVRNYMYRYPSSKVTYDSQSYGDHRPRSASSDLKDAIRSKYKGSTYSKPNTESEYHSGYDSPPSVTDNIKYKSRPSKFSEHSDNHQSISPSNYDDPSTFNTHSSLEYGSRYPTSYRTIRHTDSKSPMTSHFTLKDVKSPDSVHHYEKKPKSGSTESHSHYHYDDSSEIPDAHSAKKNYSPVRPAPLHDQLEQPRYPPLPRQSKRSKDKKYYDSEEAHSKENSENYNPESSHTSKKSFNSDSYSNYNRDSYKPLYSQGKTESHYPTSDETHYYSDHSSEETDYEPVVHTKTTYTKPYKDSSTEHNYSSDNTDKSSHKPSMTDYSTIKTYSSGGKDVVSQQEYSRPIYKESQRYPLQYLHSHAYKGEKKPSANASLPISYSSLPGVRPKRVEGIVYRSRQFYPNVKTFRRYKGYLPYKQYYPTSNSAYDYKSVPSEIMEKNVTRDFSDYDLPRKTSKSKHVTHKKHITHSSVRSKDDYDDSNENSNHAAIPGEPVKDYPILKEIPYNHFTCDNKIPGFYADVANRCQVYYQCNEDGRLQSFLCPNGTIFNQLTFVCEWWYNVDCSKSEKYFSKNNHLYKLPSSPKTKNNVNYSYRRSHSELGNRENFPSYNTDDEEFRSKDNVRKLRSNVSYTPKYS